MEVLLAVANVGICILFLSLTLQGQVPAVTFFGNVTDTSRAAVPNAEVTVTSLHSNHATAGETQARVAAALTVGTLNRRL
ncbi:MAG TPA: hypothetical protein VGM27_30550 [Acidobacteriaceae bacterium]